MKVLLIGGHADGRRINLAEGANSVCIPKLVAVATSVAHTVTMTEFAPYHEYKIERVMGHHVGVYDELDPCKLVDFLVSGYRPELG